MPTYLQHLTPGAVRVVLVAEQPLPQLEKVVKGLTVIKVRPCKLGSLASLCMERGWRGRHTSSDNDAYGLSCMHRCHRCVCAHRTLAP